MMQISVLMRVMGWPFTLGSGGVKSPDRPRNCLMMTGNSASADNPSNGSRICGSKMMPRSGVSPRAKTSDRPAPTEV